MASVLNIFFTSTYFFYFYFKWELTIALHELKTNDENKVVNSFVRKGEWQKKLQITTNFFFKGRVVNAASVNVSVSREFLLFVFLLFGKAGRIEILKLKAEGV